MQDQTQASQQEQQRNGWGANSYHKAALEFNTVDSEQHRVLVQEQSRAPQQEQQSNGWGASSYQQPQQAAAGGWDAGSHAPPQQQVHPTPDAEKPAQLIQCCSYRPVILDDIRTARNAAGSPAATPRCSSRCNQTSMRVNMVSWHHLQVCCYCTAAAGHCGGQRSASANLSSGSESCW